jgi:hypothetical protein
MRGAILAMLWIGVAGTAYQAGLLRVYLPAQERLERPETVGLAERAMAWRLGLGEMDRRVAKDAVVQFDTEQPNDFFGYAQILLAGRQMASALPTCAAGFGGDPAKCSGVEEGVERLFAQSGGRDSGQLGVLSAEEARVACGRLGVSDLVATRWDRVWADTEGWVWSLPAVVDTGEVRVLECGGGDAGRMR